VLFIDLDDFKPINDTYGHEAGDNLLVAVAHALQRSVLGSDTVGRLGGDEFAVILGDIDSENNAVAVASRILGALTEPITVGGATIRCRASIGIAVSQPGYTSTDELLNWADTAMYHAKRAKDTGWARYRDSMTPRPIAAERAAHRRAAGRRAQPAAPGVPTDRLARYRRLARRPGARPRPTHHRGRCCRAGSSRSPNAPRRSMIIGYRAAEACEQVQRHLLQ
jgi:diguanylate cyclase (GGDEF)-like protein